MYRILSKIPYYQKYLTKKLQNQSKFYIQNRIKVIDIYRHYLKIIPKIYPRTLQQAQKINQLKWIFKQSKQLTNIYQIQGRTQLAMNVLNQINKGQYSRLGDLIPKVQGNKFRTMIYYLHFGTQWRKRQSLGYIYW